MKLILLFIVKTNSLTKHIMKFGQYFLIPPQDGVEVDGDNLTGTYGVEG